MIWFASSLNPEVIKLVQSAITSSAGTVACQSQNVTYIMHAALCLLGGHGDSGPREFDPHHEIAVHLMRNSW